MALTFPPTLSSNPQKCLIMKIQIFFWRGWDNWRQALYRPHNLGRKLYRWGAAREWGRWRSKLFYLRNNSCGRRR